MMKRQYRRENGAVYVPLTRGFEAIVDEESIALIDGYSWSAKVSNLTVYARRAERVDGRSRSIAMHRVILGAVDGQEVDHINGNGLDNRRANLRIATHAQNQRNRGPQANSTSGFRGVTWHKAAKRWCAQIKTNGRNTYLGLFDTRELAYAARLKAEAEQHGAFSWGAENGVEWSEPKQEAAA